MSLGAFGERLWHNWRKGEGPCGGCPNRDCNGHFRPKNIDAEHTCGDIDPQVVIVADAPSDRHKDGEHAGEMRQVKDFYEDQWDQRSNTVHTEIQGWDPAIDMLLDGRVDEIFFETLGLWPRSNEGIYYTNAKKCADIEGGSQNVEARKTCSSYLEEHLDILNPDVVVPVGGTALDQVRNIYRIKDSRGVTKLAPHVAYDERQPVVVPSIHWSYLGTHTEEGMGDREYWESLAETVEANLSDN